MPTTFKPEILATIKLTRLIHQPVFHVWSYLFGEGETRYAFVEAQKEELVGEAPEAHATLLCNTWEQVLREWERVPGAVWID
jgi:hypothetical protein